MVRVHPVSRRAHLVHRFLTITVALLATACGDGSGPEQPVLQIAAVAGAAQFGLPGEYLADSLAVSVTEAGTTRAADDTNVQWRITNGAGATLSAPTSTTDGGGIARILLRLGQDTGSVRVEADVSNRSGDVAVFEARAVRAPVVESVMPLPVRAGEGVTVAGQGFSARAQENTVLFGGRRARVLTASATSLEVEVPPCLPSRTLEMQVRLGAVGSNTLDTPVAGEVPDPIDQPIGTLLLLHEDDLTCLALDGGGGVHLVVPLNGARTQGVAMPFELTGLAGQPVAVARERRSPTGSAALAWETQLRALERSIPHGAPPVALSPQRVEAAAAPEIGDRAEFNVLTRDNDTDRITAEVRAISKQAIIYEDLDAPAGGFSQAELEEFGAIFDDPIHPTDVAVFGSPSDVDANGRVIILLTPRVNALTESDDDGFIAGFFYGCDLVEAARCSDTNRAEIFYSMVPDPAGQFGSPRSRNIVLRTVPGVLAHEFQHMINFGRKGRLDHLWLSEGLAHMAEELVGRAFHDQGELLHAADFLNPNYTRARAYLGSVSFTSLVDQESPGTLELRGGAWLFVEYLYQQYGREELLDRLTASSALGADNVEEQTGRDWEDVFAEFAVALWASGAPELGINTVDQRLTFGTYPLRAIVAPISGYPLPQRSFQFADITLSGSLPPASAEYFLFRPPPGGSAPFTLSLSGRWGADFVIGTPRLAVLRVN